MFLLAAPSPGRLMVSFWQHKNSWVFSLGMMWTMFYGLYYSTVHHWLLEAVISVLFAISVTKCIILVFIIQSLICRNYAKDTEYEWIISPLFYKKIINQFLLKSKNGRDLIDREFLINWRLAELRFYYGKDLKMDVGKRPRMPASLRRLCDPYGG